MDKYLQSQRTTKATNTCEACKQNITTASFLNCVSCKSSFHPICVNASSSNPSKVFDWKCPTCRAGEPKNCNQNTPALSLARLESPNITGARPYKRQALSSPDQVQDMEEKDSEEDLLSVLRFLRLDISEIKSCLVSLTEGMAKFSARQDEFDSRIRTLEERESIIKSLNDDVQLLKQQLNYQTQMALNKEVEVVGISETVNENLQHIVMVTASKVGVKLDEGDIESVTRVGQRVPKDKNVDTDSFLPRPIIVKLVRKGKRDEFLRAAKVRRHSTILTSSELNLEGPPRKIYINEHLTKANRLLFRNARQRARESGFRFCWINNGRVYLRRDEGKPAIAINTLSNLDRVAPERGSGGLGQSETNADSSQHA